MCSHLFLRRWLTIGIPFLSATEAGAGELPTGLSDPSAFNQQRDLHTLPGFTRRRRESCPYTCLLASPPARPTPTVSFWKAGDKSCPFGFPVLGAMPETQDMEFKSELSLHGSNPRIFHLLNKYSLRICRVHSCISPARDMGAIRREEAIRRQPSQCLGHINNILASSKRFP